MVNIDYVYKEFALVALIAPTPLGRGIVADTLEDNVRLTLSVGIENSRCLNDWANQPRIHLSLHNSKRQIRLPDLDLNDRDRKVGAVVLRCFEKIKYKPTRHMDGHEFFGLMLPEVLCNLLFDAAALERRKENAVQSGNSNFYFLTVVTLFL